MTPKQVKDCLSAAGHNSIIIQDYIDCCIGGATAAYFLQFNDVSLKEDFQSFYDTFYIKNTQADSDAAMWRWIMPDGSVVDLTFGKGL